MRWMTTSALALLACSGPKGETGGDEPTGPVEIIDGTPAFYDKRPKNVLMLSIDTFRTDYMKRYGGNGVDMAYLDTLAEQGFVMDEHSSCSNWTHAGTLCAKGVDHFDLGYPPHLSNDLPNLDPHTNLASTLTDLGFHTIMITSNSWMVRHNIQYGYSHWEHPSPDRANKVWEYARETLFDIQTANVNDLDKPWFLHVHFKEPHIAYKPPDEYLEDLEDLEPLDYDLTTQDTHYELTRTDYYSMSKEEQDNVLQHLLVRYRGEMQYLDDQIRDIMKDAKEFGLLEDTLVVFWTDHGEQFFEHGKQSHAYQLYGEETDALFLLWADNIVPGSWKANTTHTDIAPTVISALGHDVPKEFPGKAVGTADPDRYLFGSTIGRLGTILSVTQGNHRMHYTWSGGKELYNLREDPGEQVNLYDPKDPTVIELWEALMPKVDQMQKIAPEQGKPYDPGP